MPKEDSRKAHWLIIPYHKTGSERQFIRKGYERWSASIKSYLPRFQIPTLKVLKLSVLEMAVLLRLCLDLERNLVPTRTSCFGAVLHPGSGSLIREWKNELQK